MLQNRTPRTPTATGPATPPVATTHRTRPRGHLPAQDGRLPAPAGSSPPSDTEKAPAPRGLFFISHSTEEGPRVDDPGPFSCLFVLFSRGSISRRTP